MGGKASRDKGQRAEREFAKLVGGHSGAFIWGARRLSK
jgi:hypothetical protein